MRRKLLFAAAMVAGALGMRAADLPTSGSGEYFLKNVETGTYLKGDAYWGTKAVVWNDPYALTLTYLSDGVYTIQSQQNNGGQKQYITTGEDPYVDGDAANMTFTEVDAVNHYYTINNGTGNLYATQITLDGATLYRVMAGDVTTNNAKWQVISRAELVAALDEASESNPVDATFFIKDAGIDVKSVNASSWSVTNVDLGGGGNAGHSAESWNKASFNMSQTITGLPNGKYRATCYGYYRWNGADGGNNNSGAVTAHANGTEVLNAVFFAGTKETPLMSVAGDESATSFCTTMKWDNNTPNNQWQAAACFTQGFYLNTIEDIGVTDGTLTIGVKKTTQAGIDWAVFDEFKLYYLGGDLSIYVTAYNEALAEAQTFTEASMYSADWTALQTAITGNTLNLNDPELTESALTTATANLVAANTAATAAVAGKTNYDSATTLINGGTNVDLTSLMANPGFELGNTNGWTNEGSITANAQGNSSFDNKQGSYYCERWHVSGTIDINQTLACLPAGIYQIEAYMYSDTGDAKLYANRSEANVSKSGKYSVFVENTDKGSIKIGASCTLTGSTWICMDDFKLTYFGNVEDLTYTLATGKMSTDKSAAQIAAENTYLADKTVANYNALLAAIAEAEASVANYTALKAAIDKAEAVKEANNFVTADATTAFESEIATATAAWTNATYTDAEATAEIAVLGSAVSGWHAIASEGKAGAFMASAWGKTSENWWDAPYINTWSTEGDKDGTGFSVPFFEYYANDKENLPAKTMTATLTGMEKGRYEVELWARVQRRSDADFNSDASMITMSVNGGDAVSIMNGSTTVGTGTSTMRLGRYTATGDVTEDGNLTLSIDVKLGSNVHWLTWRDVKYTKLDEADMSITDAKYATFVAPFDVTIPDGVEAYTIDGAVGLSLTLTPVETTIPVNTPVLLYSDNTFDDTFYGKAVAGEVTAGLLTGVYAETDAPVGSYVLQNQEKGGVGFYRVADAKKVPAYRAYLTCPTDPEGKAFYLPQGELAAIETISALQGGKALAIYTAGGAKVQSLQKGINIVKMQDGTIQKVFVK